MNRHLLPAACVVVAAALAVVAVARSRPARAETPSSASPGSVAPASAPASTRPAAAASAAVPPALVGDWFWGNVSPTRYWDRNTGDFVGHGYSGALSYVFAADGTYKRYFYLETRLGGDVSGIFTASEGTVTFAADGTFTLRPTKGTYRFTNGRKPPRERPMQQDELERPGLEFTWRLEKDADGGRPVLKIAKPGEDARVFQRSKE